MNRSLKILVVDDDADNADSLGELFELEGHQSHVVYSGKDAIQAYLQSPFDIAFVDVMMPGMNGVESFMEIRRLRPHAKVFMMSGYSVEELLKQAIAHGALGLLGKPVAPEKVLALVNDVGQNGLVVAPQLAPGFAEQVLGQVANSGAKCQIIRNNATLATASPEGVLILDLEKPLIDSMSVYSSLRKAHDMPPTVILTPPSPEAAQTEALREVTLTGVLNKPFDPEQVLASLGKLVA